jgi:hypothetical protein
MAFRIRAVFLEFMVIDEGTALVSFSLKAAGIAPRIVSAGSVPKPSAESKTRGSMARLT